MIGALRPVVEMVARRDAAPADQMRAAQSVALNLGEAPGSCGGNVRQGLHSALGSAGETREALKMAMTWGYVADISDADSLLDQVIAMTCRGLNPRR